MTDSLSRITPMVINSRFSASYEANIDPNQYGFRQDYSTIDNLFVFNQVRKSSGERLYADYIDLTCAFDKLPRRYLFEVLRKRTGANKLVNILKALYTGTKGRIGNSDCWFDVGLGVRQGSVESPPCFVWYFDFVLKIVKKRVLDEVGPTGIDIEFKINHGLMPKRGEGTRVLNGRVNFTALKFADDYTGLSKGPEMSKRIIQIIDEECTRYGLYISYKKTHTQELPVGDVAPIHEDGEVMFEVNGNEIKQKSNCKLLGQYFNNLKPKNGFLGYRIGQASGQFQKYRHVLK